MFGGDRDLIYGPGSEGEGEEWQEEEQEQEEKQEQEREEEEEEEEWYGHSKSQALDCLCCDGDLLIVSRLGRVHNSSKSSDLGTILSQSPRA